MLRIETKPLESSLVVEAPVRGKLILSHGCCGCVIEVADRRLPFSLVLLDIIGFDVILSIDWLSSYHDVIDYYHRRVTVCTAGVDCFYFMGHRTDRLLTSSYDTRSGGIFTFLLATLMNDGNSETRGVFPRVICEYFDVFLEDLTELPPYREKS
ncbi:hypothetical protein ACSBR1_029840 [Camellia fascicularis]